MADNLLLNSINLGTESSEDLLSESSEELLAEDVGYLLLESGDKLTLDAGETSTSSSKSSYLKGQATTNVSKSAYIEGSIYRFEVEWITVGIPTTSNLQSSTSKSAYINGLAISITSKPVYVKGKLSTVINKSSYIKGKDSSITFKSAYIKGRLSIISNKASYIEGYNANTSSKPVYIKGKNSSLTSKSSYIKGVFSSVSNKAVYTKGINNAVIYKSAYIRGGLSTTSSKSAYTTGSISTKSSKASYIKGFIQSSSVTTNKPVYISGKMLGRSSKQAYMPTEFPPIVSNVGYFITPPEKTVGQTITISGLSNFVPKLILLWWTGIYVGSGNGHGAGGYFGYYTSNVDLNSGFGAGISDSNRFCVVGFSQHNVDTTNTYRSQNNTEIVRIYKSSGNAILLDGILDFYSVASGQFTLVVDDQFSKPYVIGYNALGGTGLTDVYIGNGTLPTATGIFDTTGVGFKGDALIMTTQKQQSLSQESDNSMFSLGFAVNDSQQGVISTYSEDNQASSIAKSYHSTSLVYANITTIVGVKGSFDSFTDDGFRLNSIVAGGEDAFYYIVLKGGKYHVEHFYVGNSSNTIYAVSGIGFPPLATILMSALQTNELLNEDSETMMGFSTQLLTNTYDQIAQSSHDYDYSSITNAREGYSDLAYLNADYWGEFKIIGYHSDGFYFWVPPNGYDYPFVTTLCIGRGGTYLSSKNSYIKGLGNTLTSKQSYINGTTTNARVKHSSYIKGLDSTSSSKPNYISGGIIKTTSKSCYIKGRISLKSEKSCYIHGGINPTDSKQAYIKGLGRSIKSAYIEGLSPNISVKHAYIFGVKYGPDIWIS